MLAAIGRPPGTVEDCFIVVRKDRRRKIGQEEGQTLATLDARRLLDRRLTRWTEDISDTFCGVDEVDVPAPSRIDLRAIGGRCFGWRT